jgi:hypothetical protein
MHARKQFRHGWPHLAVLGAAAIWLALPLSVPAQDTPQQLRVRVEESSEPLPSLNLRPNTITIASLYLQNPTPDDFRNFTVKLVQILGDEVKVIAQAEVPKLLPREEVRVVFAPRPKEVVPKGKEPEPPKPKEPKEAKEPKEGIDGFELAGPPFRMQLWIEPKLKGDFPPIKRELDLLIREPRDYLAARARYDALASKLSLLVNLDTNEKLVGPAQCPLELTLGPELVLTKKGAFKQVVSGAKTPVELHAENLKFAGPGLREGLVYLNVDGYDRAFVYPVRLAGSGDLSALDFGKKVGVRIRIPAFTRPSAKLPVRLELDGTMDGDYRVEVSIDRAGTREAFGQTVKLPGLRHQKARIGVAPTGDLICQTEVRDWEIEFDTTGVYGPVWLRVMVFKRPRDGTRYEGVELTVPAFAGLGYAPMEIDVSAKRAYARLVQDDSRPEIDFVALPREWSIIKPLLVKMAVVKRGAHQAPVESVTLLRGKVPLDGKINPEAVLGLAEFDAKTTLWLFTLPPREKPEPLEFSAVATTAVGMAAARTATVLFKDYTAGGKGIARIVGKVSHGTNPVPNAAVTLADEKGAVKGSAKTDDKGAFAFVKVPPGNYVISAMQTFPALVGQAKVQVPEGVEMLDPVPLRLLAK